MTSELKVVFVIFGFQITIIATYIKPSGVGWNFGLCLNETY